MKFGVVTEVSTFLVITQWFLIKITFSSLADISTFMLRWFRQCKILCHGRYVWPCTVSVDYLSGLALLQSVVTVTVAISAAKASWVVVMYTIIIIPTSQCESVTAGLTVDFNSLRT